MSKEAMKLALEDYMSAFGKALEAHGIPFSEQQIKADKQAREALAKQSVSVEQSAECVGEPVAHVRVRGGMLRGARRGDGMYKLPDGDYSLHTKPQPAPVQPAAWIAPEQCYSPAICRIGGACVGLYDTQKKCTTPPAAQPAAQGITEGGAA